MIAFFAAIFGLFVDILWAAAISYGAMLIASAFTKKPKNRMPDLGGYPIQTAEKGIAIPKVYGCERVAGNVAWLGVQNFYEKKTNQSGVDGHVRVKTYFRSFLIGICEGEGNIIKIWMDKVLIWAADGSGTKLNNDTQTITVAPASIWNETPPAGSIRISKGNNTQDARFYTEEIFGKYEDLIWAYFHDFETGVNERIPNFTFEVCSGTPVRYTLISDNGEIWGVPLFGTLVTGLDEDGVAVDMGAGVASLPYRNHPYIIGDEVIITGSVNYNGTYTLLDTTTDDELHITKAIFKNETFDGTETAVKHIDGIGAGVGRMAVDGSGNIWYGHNADVDQKMVTRIAPDGTKTNDDLNGVFAGTCYGVFPATVYDPDTTLFYIKSSPSHIACHDLVTGDQVWAGSNITGGFQAAKDALDNIYNGSGEYSKDAVQYDAETGEKFVLVGFGSNPAPGAFSGNGTMFNMVVDDERDWLIGGGEMANLVANSPEDMYNLCARQLVRDPLELITNTFLAVGGYYVDGPLNHTYQIVTGNVQTYAGFIYVLAYTPNPTLYKIQYDPGVLTVLSEAIVATSAQGFFFNEAGYLVLIPSIIDPDRFWYYDTDLNFLGKASNLPSALGSRWGGVGGTYIQGNAAQYPRASSLTDPDMNPATMIDDLSRNKRYGAGIGGQYIDAASVSTQYDHWEDEENRISLALSEQRPLTDWVDFILGHCNGFRFWSEGQFHIGAFKEEAAIASFDQDDIIREEGENAPPPVQIVKRKASETSNLVELSWRNRANTYDISVAMAKDDVDQRVSGKVRIHPADLTGIHIANLAQRQVYRLLFEGMYRFTIYSFDVSYKRMLFEVGDVVTLSDGGLIVDEKVRIIAREEDKDGRSIHIEAVEDVARLYPDIAYITQPILALSPDGIGSDDLVTGTLSFREDITAPRLYFHFAPGDVNTDGALVYRSYDDILYEFIGRIGFDRDELPNSVGTTTSALPRAKAVTHRYDELFTVDIGEVTSLRTDVSDVEFWGRQSLAKIDDEVIAFKRVEDQGSGIWRITQTIRGLFGTEAVEHAAGSVFATLSPIDLTYTWQGEVAGQVMYFKPLATYGAIVSQTLADVDPVEYTVIREDRRPYPLSVQGVKDAVGLCTVNAFPVVVEFNLASKASGYNWGGFGEVGWGNFTKDERIIGINVTLKTIDGTQILFEFHSLDGYHASDYEVTIAEADRLGNDPVLVAMAPVAALPSSKVTANMIDLVP